jgi:ABC-type multidrug transport system ATPase subunit
LTTRLLFDHVFFSYAPRAFGLKDISFSFDATDVVGLAGANGSGKTTLIRILLGQLVGFKGEYRINGQIISDVSGSVPFRFSIGYAPDSPVLDDALTGYEILSLVADIRKINKPSFDADIALFTSQLHIEDWMQTKRCAEYSTGMRRKISLAVAFLGTPSFVILDEPTNGLDPVSVFGLKKVIAEKKARGCGCLIASHILDFVEKTADHVLLLKNGSLLYGGSLPKIFDLWPGNKNLEEIYMTLFSS